MHRWLGVLVATLAIPAVGEAHQGAQVSKAKFQTPPEPTAAPTDGGLVIDPYTFSTADTSFTVTWTVDFPMDPTGKFDFYYGTTQLPTAVTYDNALAMLQPIPEASGANAYWISCTCPADMGITCPTDTRINCNKLTFDWNTTNVPAGAYWIFAFNNDPPYKIYSNTQAPVRIAHGGSALPPAATFIFPDGLFAWNKTSPVLWLATGAPPLRFDLFYGHDTTTGVLDPPMQLAMNVTPKLNPDGTFGYDWDVSQYADDLYYVQLKVTDGNGQSINTNSYYGANVYHPPEDGGLIIITDLATKPDGAAPDLSVVLQPIPDGGCSCNLEMARSTSPIALGLFVAAVLWLMARRRSS